MRSVSKLRLAVLVAGSMFAASIVPAGASAADWSPKVSIPGTGNDTTNLDSVAAPNGAIFAYWTRTIGGDEIVQSVRIKADDSTSPIQNLSPPGQDAKSPVAVVSPVDGTATVAWVRSNGTSDIVQTVTETSAGAVGTVTDRSAAGNALQNAESPDLAVASNGSVGLTWRRFNGPTWVAQAMTISAAGVGGTVRNISDTAFNSQVPRIAAASASTFRMAWIKENGLQSNIVTTVLQADGAPGDLTSAYPTVGNGATGYPRGLDIGLNPAGVGMISWVQFTIVAHKDPETGEDILDGTQYAAIGSTVSAAGAVGSPTQLSPVKVDISDVNLTFNEVSKGSIDWLADPQAVGAPTQTQWSPVFPGKVPVLTARTVSPDVAGDLNPSLAIGAGGYSTIGWTQNTLVPGQTDVFASRVSANATQFPGVELSTALKSSQQAAVSVDGTGDPTTLFYGVDLSDVGAVYMTRFTDPGISISPAKLEFGQGLLNVTNASRIASVVSSGSTSLGINSVTLSGPDAGDFKLGNASPCSAEIAPGVTCDVKVSFAPTTAGGKTAQINLNTDAGTKVVQLGGKAVARTRVSLKVKPKNRAQKRGKVKKLTVSLKNFGGINATGVKICAYGNKRVVRPKKTCKTVGTIGVGKTVTRKFGLKLNGRAKKGKKYAVNFQMKAGNANSQRITARLRLK